MISSGLYEIPEVCARRQWPPQDPPVEKRYAFFVRPDGFVQVECVANPDNCPGYVLLCRRGGVSDCKVIGVWTKTRTVTAHYDTSAEAKGASLNEAALHAAPFFGLQPIGAVHGPVIFGWECMRDAPHEMVPGFARFGVSHDVAMDAVRKFLASGNYTFLMEDEMTCTLVNEALATLDGE